MSLTKVVLLISVLARIPARSASPRLSSWNGRFMPKKPPETLPRQ